MSAYTELNNARDEWEEYEAREAIKHEANEENRAEREELMERVEAVRMTPKEAINILEFLKQYVTTNEIKPIEMSIDALEKSDKYRWHDLRKDPNDLPEIDPYFSPISKRVYFSTKDDAYTGTYDHQWKTWDSDGYEGLEISGVVIAWREIEPFEVKE